MMIMMVRPDFFSLFCVYKTVTTAHNSELSIPHLRLP